MSRPSHILLSALHETASSLRSRRWIYWGALMMLMTVILAIGLPTLIAADTGLWRGWQAEFSTTDDRSILRFSLPFLGMGMALLAVAPLLEFIWQSLRIAWRGRQ